MLIHGDSLAELKNIESASVDLLCTDPPYGYSFMGKSWDKTLPDIGIFKECLRVLKPGAFAFVMSAPRSDVCARMMLMLEDAGFEIGFTPIYWTYASGFPKAMNIGKMVDKRLGHERERVPGGAGTPGNTFPLKPEAISPEAISLDGSYGGFQPKPAVEVVIVAMKPLSEKTYVDQALKNGKGITWLDSVRVPTNGETLDAGGRGNHGRGEGYGFEPQGSVEIDQTKGRFPANLLVSDDVLNDGTISRSTVDRNPIKRGTSKSWFTGDHVDRIQRGDEGGYSRFFSLDSWAQTLPFLAVPKASKSEKNNGLDRFEDKEVRGGGGRVDEGYDLDVPEEKRLRDAATAYGAVKAKQKNSHPTVKPLKLMSYLITLGSRQGDTVLDPFMGSGTTCVAAKELGRQFIGIERESEYMEIASARVAAATDPEPKLFAA